MGPPIVGMEAARRLLKKLSLTLRSSSAVCTEILAISIRLRGQDTLRFAESILPKKLPAVVRRSRSPRRRWSRRPHDKLINPDCETKSADGGYRQRGHHHGREEKKCENFSTPLAPNHLGPVRIIDSEHRQTA
jgi:hypothetical protein